jgi:hypothetical protein
MSTKALSKFHSTASSIEDLDASLAKGQENRPKVNSTGKPFLRLDQEGNGFMYGADNVEVEENSHWAINPFSFRSGHVTWADPKKNGGKREKLGEIMAPIANAITCPDTDHSAKGGEWKEQFGFDLICISGEDEGEEVAFNTDSHGGKYAFDSIFDAVATRPNAAFCFPVVALEFGSYKNRTWNKTIYTPVFKVMDWSDMDQNLLAADGPPKKVEETSGATDDNVPNAPEVDADQAPKRRRRQAV